MTVAFNKPYRTRSGLKVILYTIESIDSKFPVIGHIIDKHGFPIIARWRRDGSYSMVENTGTSYNNIGHEFDLIIDENG